MILSHCLYGEVSINYYEERRSYRAKIYRFISKHGSILCALAILVAPIACEQCRVLFYEPVEPKGLDMFIKEHKNNFKENEKLL